MTTDTTDTIAAARALIEPLTGYTPGPWTHHRCPCGHSACNQHTISTQGGVGFQAEDARLIAAAPDMRDMVATLADAVEAEQAEVERLTKGSICEVAATNPSVMEYMRHWEGRAEKAETERDTLVAAAYEAAAKLSDASAERNKTCPSGCRCADGWHIAMRIRSLTPADAQAALDKMLAAAWLEGRRAKVAAAYEAAEDAAPCCPCCQDAIRTLIPSVAKANLDKLLVEARLEGWRAGQEGMRKRAEKAETERDEWKDEYQTAARLLNLYKEASVNRQIERDQAIARIAAAYEAAASVCRERHLAYEKMTARAERSGPSHPDYICDSTYHHWSGKSSAYSEMQSDFRALTPTDAQAALDKLLAEARLEGWRAGRDAAARSCVLSGQDLAEGDWGPEGRDMAVMLEARILALPEPKEASHGQ